MDDKVANRITYLLDDAGRVVGIETQSRTSPQPQICLVRTDDLVRRANMLLHTLQTWRETWIDDQRKMAGYRQALEEVRTAEETEALREAIRQLRPYLALTACAAEQGMLFPQAREPIKLPR